MGYSRKKNQTELGHGISISRVILKRNNVVNNITYPSATKKEVEFRGVFKIEQLLVEFPWVLFFDLIHYIIVRYIIILLPINCSS